MTLNPNLKRLEPYPFELLKQLVKAVQPPSSLKHIALSIGEPKHPPPEFVERALKAAIGGINRYPTTRGTESLRSAIAEWLTRRYQLPDTSIDANTQILPVNGTREAIFAFTQTIIDASLGPTVVSCNPFYQIYEGAAILAGAEPWYLNCTAKNDFIADLDSVPESIWQRCQLLHLCSPGNPSGAVMRLEQMQHAIRLAHRYDFVVVSDECYSEIYLHELDPPPGLLEASARMGNADFKRCMVFHSLSKRSNLPGLRSGFAAGDASLIENFFLYRTYHGSAMSPTVQAASTAAWGDESHVVENRRLYREKFTAVTTALRGVLSFPEPRASFYLWPETPIDDIVFARELYRRKHVSVLPGQFMSRHANGANPGCNRIRMALVADTQECVEAAHRIASFIEEIQC